MRTQRRFYFVLAATVILPLLLFAALQGSFLLESARARVEADALNRARIVNAAVDGMVLADQGALQVLATSRYLSRRDWAGARARVGAVQATRPRWREAFLTDTRTGRLIWRTRGVAAPEEKAPKWIIDYLRADSGSATGPMAMQRGGCPCMTVHAPVMQGGEARYLLSVLLGTGDFQSVLVANTPPESISAIVDTSGRFIARSREYPRRLGGLATRYVRAAIAAQRQGVYSGVTYEGFKNYTAFETSSVTGWSTHMAVSHQLLGGPRLISILLTLAAAGSALGLAAVLLIFFRRQLADRRREEAFTARAERLSAIGQVASGVAHDFNNLLTVISTSAAFLEKPALPEARRRRYVKAIADSTQRAAALTGQLLAFARRQPLAPVDFDVGDEVEREAQLVRSLVGDGVTVTLDLCDPPVHARADINQFQAMLLNLAANARDAMDGSGDLCIAVSRSDGLPAARGRPRRSGPFVAIEVRDSGMGIEAARLEQIFEPFYTSKAVGKGTGLGLSQVLGFAQQSGGDVTVESELGRGTVFRIFLPASETASVRPAKALAASEQPPSAAEGADSERSAARVLVVEDDESVGQISTEMLRDLGFRTTWVVSAEEALGLLALKPLRFDLVMSDVVMPGMSGLDLAAAVRREHPDLPILLVSGYSNISSAEELQGLQLLNKPFSSEALSAAIRRTMSGSGTPADTA